MSLYDDAADLYDRQYASYRDDLPFYVRLADDLGGPVLELGTGTGRVTAALARAGHEVVALEPAAAMRARAAARLEAEGLAGIVELIDGDMRDAYLGRVFPLVIAPFNALMHLYAVADQDAALARVAAHLAPGGVFACDLFVPRFTQLGVVRSEPFWAGHRWESATDGGERSDLFVVQHDDQVRQVLTSTYLHDTVAADGTLRRRVATLHQRYYTRYEFERALQHAGLRPTLHGGFDKCRFDESSAVMVWLARRPDGAD